MFFNKFDEIIEKDKNLYSDDFMVFYCFTLRESDKKDIKGYITDYIRENGVRNCSVEGMLLCKILEELNE